MFLKENDNSDQNGEALRKELNLQMRTLSRRSRTVSETCQRLQDKDIPEEDIDVLISKLLKYNFLNDRRYSGEYVRSKLRLGFGPMRIEKELQERGVDQLFIEQALEEEMVDLPELVVLREVLEKRLRARGTPSLPKELKSLVDFLLRRGFSMDLVRRELDSFYESIL